MIATRLGNTKQISLSNSSCRIVFDGRYYARRIIRKGPRYTIYQGIDTTGYHFVTIYIKETSHSFYYGKKPKAELRNKVSPQIMWSGMTKQKGNHFDVEIHSRNGPSLRQMFDTVKEKISAKDLMRLMYQMIKLVEKINTMGYVFREMDLNEITFDSRPEKGQLYFMNAFPLRKKGDESPSLTGRYCSIGAHLGIRASYKDDLESLTYILLDIYTEGDFLRDVSPDGYLEYKLKMDFSQFNRQIPTILKEFYHYSISLNFSDEVNFFQWRSRIYDMFENQTLTEPYRWMMAKTSSSAVVEEEKTEEEQQEYDLLHELGDELEVGDKDILKSIAQKILDLTSTTFKQ